MKILKYFNLKSFNILKFILILIIILFVISYLFYRRKTFINKFISYICLIFAFTLLFMNNIWKQDYSMNTNIYPYSNISEIDRDRILQNYCIIETTYGAQKPTTWWEDGDFDVSNNLENYRSISINTAFIVHKIENQDITTLQFYGYYTTNGESVIEGSSHLHDFSKYYLYFYQNDTIAYAKSYSTYNYNTFSHEIIFKNYIQYINGHDILIQDVSTNEYANKEVTYNDKQIEQNFNRYELSFKNMNNFEKICFILVSIIFIVSIIFFIKSLYPKTKINIYKQIEYEYKESSIWVYLIMICIILLIYFPLRTQKEYLTDFEFYYYNQNETIPTYYWQNGQQYIDIYGGAPHQKPDWVSYNAYDYSTLNDITNNYKFKQQ